MFADYHTHTRYSHGRGTVRDNVLAARRRGLERIAITDHGPANIGFGIRSSETLLEIKAEVRRVAAEFEDIEVLVGVEANVISLDGQLDVDDEVLQELDLVLVGLHDLVIPASLGDGLRLVAGNALARRLFPGWSHRTRRDNTEALVAAVNRYEIDIVTHPGLKLNIDTRELAEACRRRQTALEINATHGYLTEEFARVAAREGVSFAINSDAHRPSQVGELEAGIQVALAAGIGPEQIVNARSWTGPGTKEPRERDPAWRT